jgi:hypothetical protein
VRPEAAPGEREQYISARKISNIKNQVRSDIRTGFSANGGDVGGLLRRFEDLKRDDPLWDYAFDTNEEGVTTKLWWMNPHQRSLAYIYGDVIQVDVSEGRNEYNYHLATFVVVDANNRSRTIGHCVSHHQDTETFTWMFQHLDYHLKKNRFSVIFTDRDAAMTAAINKVWPRIFHGYCLWHLYKNLNEHLSGRLQSRWHEFYSQFAGVYRQGSVRTFEAAVGELLTRWPECRDYLQNSILPCKESWAWCFVGMRFVAGIRTTGRVESEHLQNKNIGLNRGCSLNQLFDLLNRRSEIQQDDSLVANYAV